MIDPELLIHDIEHYGFHIIDEFLALKEYQALRAKALELEQQGLFKSANIGLKAQNNTNIRTDAIHWLAEDEANPYEQAYLTKTQQIASILNRHLFLGLFEFETHFAVYPPGSFYKKHVDQFTNTSDRKISCVYYLNNEWHEDFGGALQLYSHNDKLLQRVLPHGNRIICFNSELAHEVCQTNQTRYSITGWMKTRSSCILNL